MNNLRLIFQLPLLILFALVAGCITPLQKAVERGDFELTRQLIDQGADVNDKGNYLAPLCLASKGGHKDIAELLIIKGAEMDNPDACGLWGTPLIEAAMYGKKDIVRLLLAKGADPGRKNAYGYSPLQYAEGAHHQGIALLLKEAEAEGPRRAEAATEDPQEVARFEKAVQDYRTAVNKPVIPEEARKYKIQAESAVREKKYSMAAELYGEGLNIAPWWSEGHFNRALVLGESRYYLSAMREMKRYLQLVPDAPDARAAQDKIYEWELKAK